jgi:hypothetical protein
MRPAGANWPTRGEALDRVGYQPAGVHEFFSIVTHPRIYNPPTPIISALDQIEAWRESPSLSRHPSDSPLGVSCAAQASQALQAL